MSARKEKGPNRDRRTYASRVCTVSLVADRSFPSHFAVCVWLIVRTDVGGAAAAVRDDWICHIGPDLGFVVGCDRCWRRVDRGAFGGEMGKYGRCGRSRSRIFLRIWAEDV